MMIIWHTRRPSTRCPGATFSFHENQLNEFVYMSWLRRGKRVKTKTKSGKRKTENKNTRFKCMQSVAGRGGSVAYCLDAEAARFSAEINVRKIPIQFTFAA